MIQDSIGYGEGYEKATEPGPDVEILYYVNNEELIWEWRPRKKDDINVPLHNDCHYRKPIKPKEEKMEEKMITINKGVVNFPNGWKPALAAFEVPLSEALRLGEEAKRIMEEDKIKEGDWTLTGNSFSRLREIEDEWGTLDNGFTYKIARMKKIKDPSHIKALTEIFEVMK